MAYVELLTVEMVFGRSGTSMGLVFHPDFSVPDGWPWRLRQSPAVVVTPDGNRSDVTINLNIAHFNLADPAASIETRWRLVASLAEFEGDVPPGSKVLVPSEVRDAIRGKSIEAE